MESIQKGLEWFGTHFIGMFKAGGDVFVSFVTGIIPMLAVLLTFTYALIAIIGEDRVTRAIQACSKNIILRYSIMPMLSVLMLTNPMAYTFGRFVKEKEKPAFYDAVVSFLHPVTSIFPYANAGELFVYVGIAEGVRKFGVDPGPLAIRYFFVGIIVILLRGIITETITKYLAKKENIEL